MDRKIIQQAMDEMRCNATTDTANTDIVDTYLSLLGNIGLLNKAMKNNDSTDDLLNTYSSCMYDFFQIFNQLKLSVIVFMDNDEHETTNHIFLYIYANIMSLYKNYKKEDYILAFDKFIVLGFKLGFTLDEMKDSFKSFIDSSK